MYEPFRVYPLNVADEYDVFITTIGYEARAINAAKRYGKRARLKVAIGFDVSHVLSYESNRRWYEANGYDVKEVSDEQFCEVCRAAMPETPVEEAVRVLVDISSMTRARIAQVATFLLGCGREINVEFLYSPARYSPPPKRTTPPVQFGPISDDLAGWPSRPESPMSLILGLGYETDRALGTAEVLEPADLWLFRPISLDPRYHDPVERANAEVRRLLRSPNREIEYHVANPYNTFQRLSSLISGISRDGRSILIPFGPKVFALCSILVGLSSRETGVWRVSSGALTQPLQRHAAGGVVVGLSTHVPFRPQRYEEQQSE